MNDDEKYAMKVIPKVANGKPRPMDKIENEINILNEMDHPKVSRMHRFFEDTDNVYIILELCHNKSMIELMKVRHRLTENEVRWYVDQLVSGLKFIHSQKIIHRDLKLGNLFLSDKMELKIGDFGLSEYVKYEGELKTSMSGTPNYIAPEILLNKAGHSYGVDIWAIGVITYTLLVGRPPFQSKNSKATWTRIKKLEYSFPNDIFISENAKKFIQSLLQTKPEDRPELDDILNHSFFKDDYPKLCPPSTLYIQPTSVDFPVSYGFNIIQRPSKQQMVTPNKKKEFKRPRSNVKNYLETKTLFKENAHISQDYGQDSDIIILDSKIINK
jgi:polo-like kinase 1